MNTRKYACTGLKDSALDHRRHMQLGFREVCREGDRQNTNCSMFYTETSVRLPATRFEGRHAGKTQLADRPVSVTELFNTLLGMLLVRTMTARAT